MNIIIGNLFQIIWFSVLGSRKEDLLQNLTLISERNQSVKEIMKHFLCGTGTGLRLSHSVWDRYRFAAVAFYVGPVPVCGCHSLCGCMGIHRFGGPEQVDRISDSVSYIFLYLCSLFIVSSGLPVCRTVKLYFHRAQMRLIQVVSGAKFTPPPPRKYSWYSFLLHKTCAVRRCFLQVILILRCKNSSTW